MQLISHAPPYRALMARPRPPTRFTLSKNLAWLLERRNWSQRDLAKRSGVSQRQISNILSNAVACSIETAEALAGAFGLTAWLLLNSDLPTSLLESAALRKLVHDWIAAKDIDRDYLNRAADQAAKYSKN